MHHAREFTCSRRTCITLWRCVFRLRSLSCGCTSARMLGPECRRQISNVILRAPRSPHVCRHVTACPDNRPIFLLSSTVGSFYGLQIVGNLGSLFFQAATICTEDRTRLTGFDAAWVLMMFGISVLLTNMLSHRYFLEKAKGMSRVYVSPRFFPHPLSLCLSHTFPVPLLSVFLSVMCSSLDLETRNQRGP